jgi:hypothetical protein
MIEGLKLHSYFFNIDYYQVNLILDIDRAASGLILN